ncbi:hypothetical protein [Streptomyces swartbergensis]|uniref:hypothetical protein n=1 Tax=Streptomyces swartbergensis TaxID=487165 RepID=UPI003805C7CF
MTCELRFAAESAKGPLPADVLWDGHRERLEAERHVEAITPRQPCSADLLASCHDTYGDLEPSAALAVLDQLDLPADTQHLAELRHVLAAGHKHH